MHKALLSRSDDDAVVCCVCPRHCSIEEGTRGFCGVRENIGNTLYIQNYGRLTAAGLDPIEKKPLYHYLPGTQTFSISSYSCNFTCRHCQNHALSQVREMSSWSKKRQVLLQKASRLPTMNQRSHLNTYWTLCGLPPLPVSVRLLSPTDTSVKRLFVNLPRHIWARYV